MNNKKLEAIAKQASENLLAQIQDGEDEIQHALESSAKEAQLQETKLKFKIGFTIIIDTDSNRLQCNLSFGVRHVLTVEGELPDPDQPELLPKDSEGSVTLSSGGKTVEIGHAEAERLSKLITDNAGRHFNRTK